MAISVSTSDYPPRQLILKLAGSAYFERGEDYYKSGYVMDAAIYQGRLKAQVQGSYRSAYQVVLTWDGKQLGYECTCPLGEEGAFCKHCVAAGLCWQDVKSRAAADQNPALSKKKTSLVSIEDLKPFLQKQATDVLVDMLMQQALKDKSLRDRLLMKAAKFSNGKGLNLNQLKKSLRDAIQVDDFIDYHEMGSYAAQIETAVESLRDLLKEGYAPETMALAEYALSLIEDAINSVDDSDGEMTMFMESLEALHREACTVGQPDIPLLVRRLFHWQMRTPWSTFSNVLEGYADVFGSAGVALYQQLAEAEWRNIPALSPGDKDADRYNKRFSLTRIMEALAKRSGDTDLMASVLKKDLSQPYNFLRLADLYREARDPQQAVLWAEKGLSAFPGKDADGRLQAFLMQAYYEEGHRDKSAELAWNAFTASPQLKTYQTLKRYTACPDDWEDPWPKRRMEALAILRDAIIKETDAAIAAYGNRLKQTELITILLWEGDHQSAWEEAQQGGCPDSVWVELARQREAMHPRDALKIYQDQVEATLAIKKNTAYERAVQYLVKIKSLMDSLNQGHSFKSYLQSVKACHKAKRNFLKHMDAEKMFLGG